VHLAVQATRDGLRVLLLDMDPQASATAWWKRRRDEHPELIQGQGDALPGILEQARAHEYDLLIADTAPHSSADAEALRLVKAALKTYPHMLTYSLP
jgi:chromosome partitioning protein